jgi:hypothetical protein
MKHLDNEGVAYTVSFSYAGEKGLVDDKAVTDHCETWFAYKSSVGDGLVMVNFAHVKAFKVETH